MTDAIRLCAQAILPPHLALMRLFAETPDENVARKALASAQSSNDPEVISRLCAMRELWDRIPNAYASVSRIHALGSREVGGSIDARIKQLALLFDDAARISAQAGVALYSLGDAELLNAITREVVDRMLGWNLLNTESRILDIGCGSGRFLAALAPHAKTIVGVEISAAMLDAARSRTASLRNVGMLRSSGRDLAFLEGRSFDLIIAVDSFPYLVQAGVEEVHLRDCARLIRSGGYVLIMNYSYRGDAVRDCAEMESLACALGFRIVRNGTRDLQLWDGATFLLQRE